MLRPVVVFEVRLLLFMCGKWLEFQGTRETGKLLGLQTPRSGYCKFAGESFFLYGEKFCYKKKLRSGICSRTRINGAVFLHSLFTFTSSESELDLFYYLSSIIASFQLFMRVSQTLYKPHFTIVAMTLWVIHSSFHEVSMLESVIANISKIISSIQIFPGGILP